MRYKPPTRRRSPLDSKEETITFKAYPISTAPSDGREIHVYWPDLGWLNGVASKSLPEKATHWCENDAMNIPMERNG